MIHTGPDFRVSIERAAGWDMSDKDKIFVGHVHRLAVGSVYLTMASKNADDQAERESKIVKAQEALVKGVKEIKSGDDWKETLKRMAVAGKLSPARLSFNN